MTYEQALDKIHSLDKFGSRPGLDRIQKLFDMLGHGLLEQRFIHIAGTNGKGSTAQMISNVLRCAGYKTGLFISPFITDFRERIQINNQMVSKKVLTDAVERLYPLVESLNEQGTVITEFEFLTAVGFYIFKELCCDIIVCETGLGGLLDSTNLIKAPLCSVLTKIDYDHTAILGETIEEITVQKCGIIKKNSITVSAKQSDVCTEIIRKTAKERNNIFYSADDTVISDISFENDFTSFNYNGERLCIKLLGEHQTENATLSLCTLEALMKNGCISYTKAQLRDGLSQAQNPARHELISKNPLVILDGAHNVNGVESFKKATLRYTRSPRVLLIGMLKDKDVNNAVKKLCGLFDYVVATNVSNPRSMDASELSLILKQYFDNVDVVENPTLAFDVALNAARKRKMSLLVCGSLYLAGELRPHIIKSVQK